MNPKKRIGEMLLEAGIIDETQLKVALGHQRQWGGRLGQALVDLKLATEPDIVRALSVKFGFEVANLGALDPYGHQQAMRLIPREFAVRSSVFPMWADTASVTVAMSDPTNLAIVDEIRFRTGRRVKVCIGGDHEIAAALNRHYGGEVPVEAIALDLDGEAGVEGEPSLDPFGGGKGALQTFLGGEPAQPQAPQRPSAPPHPVAGHAVQPQQRQVAQPPPRGPAPAQAIAAKGSVPAAPQPRPPGPAAAAPRAPAAPPRPAPPPAAVPPAAGAVHARGAPPAPRAQAPAQGSPRRAIEVELEEHPAGSRPPPAASPHAEELTPLDEGPQNEPILASELAPPDEGGEAPRARELTAKEIAILESLDRLAGGAPAEPDVVKPAQAMAALLRLLIRKRIVSEDDFLDELTRK
jgi:hypothetical protein